MINLQYSDFDITIKCVQEFRTICLWLSRKVNQIQLNSKWGKYDGEFEVE